MGRRIVALFCCFLLLSALIAPVALAASGDTIVYVTRTGKKYHTGNCGYLHSSKIERTLQSAINSGYTPCSRCNPPRLDTASTSITQPAKSEEPRSYSSGASSSSSSSSSRSSTPARESAAAEKESNKSNTVVLVILGLIFCGCPMVALIESAVLSHKANEEQRQREKERAEEEKRLKTQYAAQYGGKTMEQLVNIPPGRWIGGDGLPRSAGIGLWGNVFTFYVSGSGKAYHERGCRYCGTIETNAYNLRHSSKTPCKVCKPVLPDMAWVDEYKRIKTIKERYKID